MKRIDMIRRVPNAVKEYYKDAIGDMAESFDMVIVFFASILRVTFSPIIFIFSIVVALVVGDKGGQ